MSGTPKQVSATLNESAPFLHITDARSEAGTLSPDTIDATNTPTTQLRRGLVVGYDAATGYYIDAADATVDVHDKAAVDSIEAPDADWQGQTLTVDVEGFGSITHTLDGSLTNLAGAIADINASPIAAFVTASAGGANLRLTANKAFSNLAVSSSLSTAYGGVTVEDDATPTKYGLLQDPVFSTLDFAGTAVPRDVTIITSSFVAREANVFGLTAAARQYFSQHGGIFE